MRYYLKSTQYNSNMQGNEKISHFGLHVHVPDCNVKKSSQCFV